jgi:glycosyltransferase involved in cell wall biosynthesis
MKIAIDATESFWPKLTGTGVYVRNLVKLLLSWELEEELFILGIRAKDTNASYVPQDALRLLRTPTYRTVWTQARLPLHLLRHRYDLLHLPDHKLPFWVPCRTVVTILDLAYMKFPESFTPMHRERLAWFTRDAVSRATHAITISQSTRDDVCTLLGVSPEKVDAVQLAVDHERFRPDVPPVRRSCPFVLSVGALQPRKNFQFLIRAFKSLCSRRDDPIELIIVGQRGWMWEPIEKEATEGPYAGRIHLKGYVPEEELASLYAGAALVAMPSLYEGFGLPLLEAMACGAPVIASNVSSFPEVLGDAGVMLPPDNEEAWVESMDHLLNDEGARARMRAQSIARARTFTWERTARETLAVYRKVLAKEPRS